MCISLSSVRMEELIARLRAAALLRLPMLETAIYKLEDSLGSISRNAHVFLLPFQSTTAYFYRYLCLHFSVATVSYFVDTYRSPILSRAPVFIFNNPTTEEYVKDRCHIQEMR